MNKRDARVRRSRKTRLRIAEHRAHRLVVGRSSNHIYAQIIAPSGDRVLVSASTLEADVRKDLKNGGNRAAATVVGKRIAEKAKVPSLVRTIGTPDVAAASCDQRTAARFSPAVDRRPAAFGISLAIMAPDCACAHFERPHRPAAPHPNPIAAPA